MTDESLVSVNRSLAPAPARPFAGPRVVLAPPLSAFDEAFSRLLRDLPEDRPLRVLEAGGGSATHVKMPFGTSYTVIDISPEQLVRNTYAEEKLLGDLETFDFGERRFDVIVCWDVLEHLSNPAAALASLLPALGPGGLLVIAGPVVSSMKGLVTKFTPHAVHVWFHRNVLGRRKAGRPGHAPFPASLRLAADVPHLVRSLERNRQQIVFLKTRVTEHVELFSAKYPGLYFAYRLAASTVRLATAGRFGSLESDFVLIARRPKNIAP